MSFLSSLFVRHKNMFDAPNYLTSDFVPYAGKNLKQITDEYGKHVSIFVLTPGRSVINIGIDEDSFFTGQAMLVTNVTEQTILFDCAKCGYDSIVGAAEHITPNDYNRFELDSESSILIVFQYSTDEEEEMAQEYGGKPADFFGTVAIYVEKSQKIAEIFSFECQ